MKGKVTVRLKSGVLDVEGKSIAGALGRLGFDLEAVHVGKVFEIDLVEGTEPEAAKAALADMARALLANPVMETFTVEVE